MRVWASETALYSAARLAEVSYLTDLPGPERRLVREILRRTISLLTETEIASIRAAAEPVYPSLGLVDAAIVSTAREHKCTVLMDDLDLYLALQRERIDVINFTHLRARTLEF